MKFKGLTKLAHKISKYAPEIMTGVGAVCTIAGTVTACKNTLKLPEKVEESVRELEILKEDKAIMTPSVYKKEVVKEKLTLAKNIGEIYAIPVALNVVGLALIISGTRLSRKRYTALASAYVTLEKAYNVYRKRVIDKYGIEEDEYFVTGVEKRKHEYIDENGKKVKEEAKVLTSKDFGSPYCFIFDENTAPSTYVKPDFNKGITPAFALDSNVTFLKSVEGYINSMLTTTAETKDIAYEFMNPILKQLGLPMEDRGQDVGIFYKKEFNDKAPFSLGLQVVKDPETWENIILLNMNFVGNIRDKVFEEI